VRSRQAWQEEFEFDVAPERAQQLLLKIWDANPLLHKEFLGQAVIDLPSADEDEEEEEETEEGLSYPPADGEAAAAAHLPARARAPARARERWHRLVASKKHAEALARRLQRQGRAPDDLGEVLLRVGWRDAATMGTNGPMGTNGTSPVQAAPEEFLHVDIASARHLLPADIDKGKDKLTSSDPYCVVKLWPTAAAEADQAALPLLPLPRSVALPGGNRRLPLLPPIPGLTRAGPRSAEEEEDAQQSATKRRTRVVNDSLDPVWNAAFAFRPLPDTTHVLITLYDKDAVLNADDYLGEVLLPLPLRHHDADTDASVADADASAVAAGAGPEACRRRAVQGWFPLECDARHERELKKILRRIGRPEDLSPPHLGELFARLSFGPERDVLDADPAHRPSMRDAVGDVAIRVLAAKGLPDRPGADAYSVQVLFEQQRASTPAARGGRSPAWAAAAATFEYRVTELTSDLVLRVMDRNEPIGEVVIPLSALLPPGRSIGAELARVPRGAPAAARWYTILRPRKPGTALLQLRSRPAVPLGRLCVAVRLRLRTPLPLAYLAPEALPPTPRHGRNEEAAPSISHLMLESSRLFDAMLAPLVAPARTVIYLQSWQAPWLSGGLAALLAAGCSAAGWPLARGLWPLALALIPVLNGCAAAAAAMRCDVLAC
jgi:hypothetical protein